ncbi:MAG: tRNA uridine-5-carboxymethylaminomethyl(34) synthesis GTPase MnmE [Eubacteriales bacterium]
MSQSPKSLKNYDTESTIAAISTPYGRGGVALIRISGSSAVEIAEKMFVPRGKKTLGENTPRTAIYGDIYAVTADGGRYICDDGIATLFAAPSSYTGEDTVEITCHGGILLSQTVLSSIFICGARPAEAGEFTKRAYLNGRLGLTRAEAIIDLIDAESPEKLRLSASQSRGVLGGELERLYIMMRELVSSVYVYIDFPDEDLSDIPSAEFRRRLDAMLQSVNRLCATYRTGRAVSEGICTCIAGKPNVGKSSLLNALSGARRAIVTDIAGTTRDIIEETVNIGRVLLRLSDTAGMRDTKDEIERIGVKYAVERMSEAELILAVFDGGSALDDEDDAFIDKLNSCAGSVIAVINKSDLKQKLERGELVKKLPEAKLIELSASGGEGIDALRDLINEMFTDGAINYDTDAVITNSRQYSELYEVKCALERACATLDNGLTQDIAGLDLEYAMGRLAEIDGRSVTSDIVDSIFHRFCVGK